MPALHTTAFELGTYRLDPVSRSVQRGSEVLPLPPKAVEVLLELARKAGQVVGKQELLDAVWPEAFVEEANLNQMIFLLRRALVDTGVGENIVTVPRRGYRLAAEVRKVEIPCQIESIAVLPLANLSGDAGQDYFADGITEALITELAKIGGLRVISRTSVMRYKNSNESIQQIARALRVQAVVEGSVMKSGDVVRITVQLIHTATDQHLWAEKYDGAVAGILELQSRIARDVALDVGGNLTRYEEIHLAVSRKVHPEAHSRFLKGRYFERNLTEEGQSRAIEYYREAIASIRNMRRPTPAWPSALSSWRIFSEWNRRGHLEKRNRQRLGPWNWMKTWLRGTRC
jgi:TolB-like protein